MKNIEKKYRSYSEEVKNEIIRTKNPNLFPELKIPRTTALYWIRVVRSNHKVRLTEGIKNKKITYLENLLKKENALKNLVINVRKIFPYNFKTHKIMKKNIKSEILSCIYKCHKHCKLIECLKSIGLSKYVYRRWKNSIRCSISKSECVKRHPLQLTHKETDIMKKFVQSSRYSHFSITL